MIRKNPFLFFLRAEALTQRIVLEIDLISIKTLLDSAGPSLSPSQFRVVLRPLVNLYYEYRNLRNRRGSAS